MNASLSTKPQKGAAFLASMTATLMIAHQVAGKATRDGLFLHYYDVTQLPKVVMGSAILSFIGVLAMSRLLGRFGPALVVPLGYGISSVLFAAEWYLFPTFKMQVIVVLYFHMAVFGAILISGFWSVVNERFDPYSAKQTVARIAAAATLGGLLGGVLTERVVATTDNRTMLLVLSGMQLISFIALFTVGRVPAKKSFQRSSVEKTGIRTVFKMPYLRQMAIVMALVAMVAALLDYAMKAQAAEYITDKKSLTSFFAAFYAIVGLSMFLIQSAFGPKMLQRFGLAGTMSVLPAAVLIGGMFSTAVLHLWTVTVLRAGEAIFASSFFRSAFELLYTPLSPDRKRPTKIIIDVGSNRLGDLLGAGVLFVLLFFIPDLPISLVISIAMAASGVAILVIARLQAGYVSQLAESLRSGTVSLSDDEIQDATTRLALRENKAISDRRFLQAKLQSMHRTGADPGGNAAGNNPGKDRVAAQVEALLDTSPERARLMQAIANLTSNDHDRIRNTLNGDFMDIGLVAYMLPLLGDDTLVDEIRMELRWLAPRILGKLTDALTDPDTPSRVRARIPEVMEVCHNQRAVDGLLEGLSDGDFSVRYSCARALSRMLARSTSLRVNEEKALEAVRRELEIDDQSWKEPLGTSLETSEADPPEREIGPNARINHVFLVLGLALDREPLEVARKALLSEDSNLKGTALEYLENVLPERVRQLLWWRLGLSSSRKPKAQRSHTEIISELRGASEQGSTGT